jgi:uncharacterized protein (DUF1800 family)
MLDSATALHLANRLGLGPAEGDVARIQQLGFDGYLSAQLNPDHTRMPASVTYALEGLSCFGDPAELYRRYWWSLQVPNPKSIPNDQKQRLKARERMVSHDARNARLARAIGSPWQLHEALVEFWFNHFNVFWQKGGCKVWIGAYEQQAIRPHTLGRFSDLLLATARHPAMLVYLDNFRNVAPQADGSSSDTRKADVSGRKKKKKNNATGINENYAREVMELHTLGVDGGYSQADVVSLAHILTGWTVGAGSGDDVMNTAGKMRRGKGTFVFSAGRHDPAPERLLGQTFSGRDVTEGEAALLMLAEHPSTAHHIGYKLAQFFVADAPPDRLVKAMARSFQNSKGDIRAVLTTMITSEEFRAPANFGTKFKTPYRYVVSVARAVGVAPAHTVPLNGTLKDLGQELYGCVTPDGYACTQAAWLSPDALVHRLSFAVHAGGGAFTQGRGGAAGAVNAEQLMAVLGPSLSKATLASISQTPKEHRAAAILGSPEFMRC